VLVLRADVADRVRMKEAIAQVRERWGPIHGVLHAAGVPGEGLIQGKERESAEKVLAPKVAGTLVLEDLLAGHEPEVTILFSSTASLTGGFGEVDYSAANLFLDAFAHYAGGRRRGRVVSINWGPWQWDAWQESLLAALPELQDRLREIRQRSGITFEEGREALRRILARADDIPQVAVLTQGYEAVMAQWGNLTAASFLEEVERAHPVRPSHPRPNLRNPYLPPRSDLERLIAAVWQELLGIEQVGIDDHFFEMGGNSLIALQALLRLEKKLAVRLSIATLFEGPTVRSLGEILSPSDDARRNALEGLDDRGRLRRERRNWRQTSQRMRTET
jgi:phthiocerol/phenolphthiocerol synthesis type-I polyketide synthase E